MIGATAIRGLWGFPLTPFDSSDLVDRRRYAEGVELLVGGGADVVIACGTLGQGDVMHPSERLACVRAATEIVADRVPVLGVLRADDELEVASVDLREAGASGILLLPTSAEPGDAIAAIERIALATDRELGIVLYRRPPLHFDVPDLERIAAEPALVGIKDAYGDLRAFRRLVSASGDRLTWIGAAEDLAVAFATHGARALAPASMVVEPRYAAAWSRALAAGDVDRAIELLRAVSWPLTDLRYSRPDIDITVIRDLAAMRGRPTGGLRPPAKPLTDTERAELTRLDVALDEVLVAVDASDAAVAAPAR